jgi:hypothetical protein
MTYKERVENEEAHRQTYPCVQEQCHVGIWEVWRQSSMHSGPWHEMKVSGKLHSFTFREKALGTHWTRGWVASAPVRNDLVIRKIPASLLGFQLCPFSLKPVTLLSRVQQVTQSMYFT